MTEKHLLVCVDDKRTVVPFENLNQIKGKGVVWAIRKDFTLTISTKILL